MTHFLHLAPKELCFVEKKKKVYLANGIGLLSQALHGFNGTVVVSPLPPGADSRSLKKTNKKKRKEKQPDGFALSICCDVEKKNL